MRLKASLLVLQALLLNTTASTPFAHNKTPPSSMQAPFTALVDRQAVTAAEIDYRNYLIRSRSNGPIIDVIPSSPWKIRQQAYIA